MLTKKKKKTKYDNNKSAFWGFRFILKFPLMMQVTPSGYAQMTHMLNALSGGKLLVILEGGFVAHAFRTLFY